MKTTPLGKFLLETVQAAKGEPVSYTDLVEKVRVGFPDIDSATETRVELGLLNRRGAIRSAGSAGKETYWFSDS